MRMLKKTIFPESCLSLAWVLEEQFLIYFWKVSLQQVKSRFSSESKKPYLFFFLIKALGCQPKTGLLRFKLALDCFGLFPSSQFSSSWNPEQVQNSTFTKRSHWDAEYLYCRHGLFNHSKSKKRDWRLRLTTPWNYTDWCYKTKLGRTFVFFFCLNFWWPCPDLLNECS